MNNAAIALMNLVLNFTTYANVADINTLDLVDNEGFYCSPIRRFRQTAVDRFGATDEQACYAAIAWVQAGRPTKATA